MEQQQNKYWNIKAKADDTIDFSIYGDISDSKYCEDDTTPKMIKEELDAFPNAKGIDIYINSGGGSAFAGVAIYNILMRSKAVKNVYIDGLAASAASVIAMAGDKIIMPTNSMLMIHKAWVLTMGNSDELLKTCDTLERVDNNIAEIYSKKTGQEIEKVKTMMANETWFDGVEAKALGFCDETEENKQVAASIKDGVLKMNGIDINSSNYKNFPNFKVKKEIEIIETEAEEEPKQKSQQLNTSDDIKKFLEDIEK